MTSGKLFNLARFKLNYICDILNVVQCVCQVLRIMSHLGWCFCPGDLRMHEYLLCQLGILLLKDLQGNSVNEGRQMDTL